MRRTLPTTFAVVVLALALGASLPFAAGASRSSPATSQGPAGLRTPVVARVAGAAIDDVEGRFLTTRPPVGPVQVVHVAGESAGRILTARTLQGLVNGTEARMYVIDGGDPAALTLLQRYEDRGLVTITGTGTLDDALARFASEAAGYVVADPAEPWSVHGAAVIAGLEGGFVTTADQVAALHLLGLTELDDTRGRWPDAASAYQALADTYGDQLASDTVAVIRADDTLWDFVIQQGILPVFTRPGDAAWATVAGILETVPDGLPVYGYLSDTGTQEAVAIAALAATELTLVPTDTTRNLSFHVAVGADQPRVGMAAPDLGEVAPCTSDTVNVVIGVTDGDNMNVPLNHFLRSTNWDSPQRGELPIGWSIGPDLAVLAPAAWDTYALEATGRDELVAMIGWAYGAPALLDDATDFYATSFALMEDLGMTTFWSLGGGLDTPGAGYWGEFDAAAGDGAPDTVLVGYGNATGAAYHSPAGRPAFTSRSVYEESPADLAGHVTDLLAMPDDERPLVSFLSATNWTNPVGALVQAMAPFEDQGVRFLTPAEAGACMPEAPEPPPPAEQGPGTCLPDDPVVQHGLALISDPVAAEITRTPLPFAPPTAVTAPATAGPGSTIDYQADLTIDLDALGAEMLATRVAPVVEAGYGPELAASAWMEMTFDDLALPLLLPPGTSPTGTPTAVSTTAGVTAAWSGDAVVVTVATVSADTRAAGTPIAISVSWSAVVDADAPTRLEVRSGPTSFDLRLDIGVILGTTPLTGGATATWDCGAPVEVLATTLVARDAPTRPTRPPGPPPTPSPTTAPVPPTTGAGPTPTTGPTDPRPTTTRPGTTTAPPPATTQPTDPGRTPAPTPPPASARPAVAAAPAATPRPAQPNLTG